jgi:hypothetical protein
VSSYLAIAEAETHDARRQIEALRELLALIRDPRRSPREDRRQDRRRVAGMRIGEMPKLSLLALRRDSDDLAFSAGEAKERGDVVDDYRIIARR